MTYFFSVKVSGLVIDQDGKAEIFKSIQSAALNFHNDKSPYYEYLLRKAACTRLLLFESEKGKSAINAMHQVILKDNNTLVKKECLLSLGKVEQSKNLSALALTDFINNLLKQDNYNLIETFEAKQAVESLRLMNKKASFVTFLKVLESDMPFPVKRTALSAIKKMEW